MLDASEEKTEVMPSLNSAPYGKGCVCVKKDGSLKRCMAPLALLGLPHLDAIHERRPVCGQVGGLTGGAGVSDALDRGDAEDDDHGEDGRSINLCE